MRSSERSGLNSTALALIPLAIAINIAIGQLVAVLKLPVYLDSIGTVLVGALIGPWVAMLTGVLSNSIWTLLGINPPAIWFAPVAAVIGLVAGFAGRAGVFQRSSPRWLSAIIVGVFMFALALFIMLLIYPLRGTPGDYQNTLAPNNPAYSSSLLIHSDLSGQQAFLFPSDPGYADGGPLLANAADLVAFQPIVFIIAIVIGALIGYFVLQNAGYAGLVGLLNGVIAAIISAPIAAYVFGGVTGGGTDVLVAAFRASGAGILASNLAQGTVSDPFDKMTSYMLVYLIVQALPRRLLQRFPNARPVEEASQLGEPVTSR
jgi:hypothetical protein